MAKKSMEEVADSLTRSFLSKIKLSGISTKIDINVTLSANEVTIPLSEYIILKSLTSQIPTIHFKEKVDLTSSFPALTTNIILDKKRTTGTGPSGIKFDLDKNSLGSSKHESFKPKR